MPVRSRRLFGVTTVGPGLSSLLYSVASGRTAIIRSVLVRTGSGVAVPWELRLSSGGQAMWQGSSTSSSPALVPYFILNPGDQLWGFNGAAVQNVQFSGFGSLLLGAPE